MNSTEFCYWLQGLFELTDTKNLNEKQVSVIKEHLQLVFTKVIKESVNDSIQIKNPGKLPLPVNPIPTIVPNIQIYPNKPPYYIQPQTWFVNPHDPLDPNKIYCSATTTTTVPDLEVISTNKTPVILNDKVATLSNEQQLEITENTQEKQNVNPAFPNNHHSILSNRKRKILGGRIC